MPAQDFAGAGKLDFEFLPLLKILKDPKKPTKRGMRSYDCIDSPGLNFFA
jgi:hypothetical protein